MKTQRIKLDRILASIRLAASSDETRPALNNIEIRQDRAFATDGHIVASCRVDRPKNAATVYFSTDLLGRFIAAIGKGSLKGWIKKKRVKREDGKGWFYETETIFPSVAITDTRVECAHQETIVARKVRQESIKYPNVDAACDPFVRAARDDFRLVGFNIPLLERLVKMAKDATGDSCANIILFVPPEPVRDEAGIYQSVGAVGGVPFTIGTVAGRVVDGLIMPIRISDDEVQFPDLPTLPDKEA